nr:MAG TPA: hypothetical protein [Caudoviricetes sp.]
MYFLSERRKKDFRPFLYIYTPNLMGRVFQKISA